MTEQAYGFCDTLSQCADGFDAFSGFAAVGAIILGSLLASCCPKRIRQRKKNVAKKAWKEFKQNHGRFTEGFFSMVALIQGGLFFFDIYTDAELVRETDPVLHPIWYMLLWLFIFLPYGICWLCLIYYAWLTADDRNYKKKAGAALFVLVFGGLIVPFLDVIMLLLTIPLLHGPLEKALPRIPRVGQRLQILMMTYAALRSLTESVFESLPQLCLQLWMKYGPHEFTTDESDQALLQALVVSIINLTFTWLTHAALARQQNLGMWKYLKTLFKLAAGKFAATLMGIARNDPTLKDVDLSGLGDLFTHKEHADQLAKALAGNNVVTTLRLEDSRFEAHGVRAVADALFDRREGGGYGEGEAGLLRDLVLDSDDVAKALALRIYNDPAAMLALHPTDAPGPGGVRAFPVLALARARDPVEREGETAKRGGIAGLLYLRLCMRKIRALQQPRGGNRVSRVVKSHARFALMAEEDNSSSDEEEDLEQSGGGGGGGGNGDGKGAVPTAGPPALTGLDLDRRHRARKLYAPLAYVDLRACGATNAHAHKLARLLQRDATVRSLDLSGNPFVTAKGCRAIREALCENVALLEFVLETAEEEAKRRSKVASHRRRRRNQKKGHQRNTAEKRMVDELVKSGRIKKKRRVSKKNKKKKKKRKSATQKSSTAKKKETLSHGATGPKGPAAGEEATPSRRGGKRRSKGSSKKKKESSKKKKKKKKKSKKIKKKSGSSETKKKKKPATPEQSGFSRFLSIVRTVLRWRKMGALMAMTPEQRRAHGAKPGEGVMLHLDPGKKMYGQDTALVEEARQEDRAFRGRRREDEEERRQLEAAIAARKRRSHRRHRLANKNRGSHRSKSSARRAQKVDTAFAKIDANGDGVLDHDEFVAVCMVQFDSGSARDAARDADRLLDLLDEDLNGPSRCSAETHLFQIERAAVHTRYGRGKSHSR